MTNIDHQRFDIPTQGRRSEREWLIPSAIMTALLGVGAVALMPAAGYSSPPPYFSRFLNWMFFCSFGALLMLAVYVVRMMIAGVDQPLAVLRARLEGRWRFFLAALAGVMLAGVDMLFFMWIKPELNAIAPFWADRLYADIDRAIFGRDPWLFFQGLDLTFHAGAYSFFWAVAIMGTIVWLFAQPPSMKRSAVLLNYFALWSIFGTVGQYIGSAAGPIFYQKIGLGDRFAELSANIPPVTNAVSGYLWDLHINHIPAIGAGISAMPSLHIATAVWVYLAFHVHGSKFRLPAAIFALYMFVLSVALGWHYAIDGVAGAAGAVLSQWAAEKYLARRPKVVAKEPAVALG